MSVHYPILPIAGGTLVRVFLALLSMVTRWIKRLVQARRHWNEATMLASLDRRMLADLGITRADVRDAFSEPFWEDPTALLRERALERRWNRALMRSEIHADVEPGFRRPPTDRPARQAM